MKAEILSQTVEIRRRINLTPEARDYFKRGVREHVDSSVTGELDLKFILNDGGVVDAFLVETRKEKLTE
jgi:hypothetical protein